MPKKFRDPSGAIIYTPTEEEMSLENMKKKIKENEKKINIAMERINILEEYVSKLIS